MLSSSKCDKDPEFCSSVVSFVNIDNEEEKLQPHKITTLQNLNSLPFIICTPTQLRQE